MKSKLIQTIDDKIVTWEYEQLCVVGTLGHIQTRLEIPRVVYKERKVGFAPIKKEERRRFLAGFYTPIPTDITIVQLTTGTSSSIVLYSLRKPEAKELLQAIVQSTNFRCEEPSESFLQEIKRSIELIEIDAYKACKKLAERKDRDEEKVFGAIRFANFLNQYVGLEQGESIGKAAKKFGLPPNFISF